MYWKKVWEGGLEEPFGRRVRLTSTNPQTNRKDQKVGRVEWVSQGKLSQACNLLEVKKSGTSSNSELELEELSRQMITQRKPPSDLQGMYPTFMSQLYYWKLCPILSQAKHVIELARAALSPVSKGILHKVHKNCPRLLKLNWLNVVSAHIMSVFLEKMFTSL